MKSDIPTCKAPNLMGISRIYYGITPSHASHVPIALIYFIAALSPLYGEYVISYAPVLLLFLVVVILLLSEYGFISSICTHGQNY
jgi:hypothetical protein